MNPSPPMIEVSNLCRYFGQVRAVDDISFTLFAGQVVGLIGSNGAGKTTAMKILTTLDMPDSGQVLIDGVDILAYPEKVRPFIGWMPDSFPAYKNTTVQDYIDFFARAYCLKGETRLAEVQRVMAFTGISDLKDRFINKLSKGQSQRLSLARTLIGNPRILILDEPAAGLDPKARLEFKQLIQHLAGEGKTILISSHILSELSEMCSHLILMDHGKIIRSGSRNDLIQGSKPSVDVHITSLHPAQELTEWLSARPAWSNIHPLESGVAATFHNTNDTALSAELTTLCNAMPLLEFTRTRRNLEEAFVSILSEEDTPSPSTHE